MSKKVHEAEIVKVEHTAEAVCEQYRKAVAGVVEMVRFGAMLLEVESCLTCETARRNQHSDETLKGWLTVNCPEVNYKTAMRFKGLAMQVRESCKLPKATSLLLCLPGDDDAGEAVSAEVAKARGQVHELLDGRSARQLMFAFASESPKGGVLGGAGLKRAPTTEERASLAWQVGIDQCQYLTGWAKDSARLLDKMQRKAIAEKLREIAELLRD